MGVGLELLFMPVEQHFFRLLFSTDFAKVSVQASPIITEGVVL